MKRVASLAIFALLLISPARAREASAQLRTGNLYGTIVDEQGQPLPGSTVTLSGAGEPQVQVTDAQGRFRFLGLAPGAYALKSELEGFSTIDYPAIRITIGRNTEVEATLAAAVEDVITVTAESPLLDERRIPTGATVAEIELEKIPTARDPWAILQQTPGVLTDRRNVGGVPSDNPAAAVDPLEAFAKVFAGIDVIEQVDESTWAVSGGAPGQNRVGITVVPWDPNQTTPPPDIPPSGGDLPAGWALWFATPTAPLQGGGGGPPPENPWIIDGVVLGDPRVFADSPTYYDFGAFEEIQVTTGGNDPTIATGGVTLNMVTKRGTNEWRGSGRYSFSGKDGFLATDDVTGGGAAPGQQLDQMLDFGGEVGGPIIKDRLWFWVSANRNKMEQSVGDLSLVFKYLIESPSAAGVRIACGLPGLNVYTSPFAPPADPATTCPQIRIDLQNLYGTGAFDGLLPDPFSTPLIRIPATAAGPSSDPAIAEDPSDPSGNTVFFSKPDGGVWKTTNFLTVDPAGPRWQPLKEPTTAEDTHIFSSNFYLTGLYSRVNGGFELVPKSGAGPAAQIPTDELLLGLEEALLPEFVIGWDPGSASWAAGGEGLPVVGDWNATPPIPGSAFVAERTDFTECPNGAWVGAFEAGNPVDLGDGVRFEPLSPMQVPGGCDGFDWKTITPRIGLTYALGEERKALLRASYARSVQPSSGPSGWFVGGTLLDDPSGEAPKDPNDPPVAQLDPPGSTPATEAFPGYTPINYNPPFLNVFPGLPGVQGVGAEIRAETGSGDGSGNGGAPGGGAGSKDDPFLYLVARGGSTGEVFDATLVSPDGSPAAFDGLAAIEPLAVSPEERAQLEERIRAMGGAQARVAVNAYCLEFLARAPAAGTVFRIAGAAQQEAFAPMARALDAARRLHEGGLLSPDTNPESYFHSIRQWAVWTVEKRFDRDAFLDAFLEHSRKNLEAAGQPWSDAVAAVVRRSADGRWKDITQVLVASRPTGSEE